MYVSYVKISWGCFENAIVDTKIHRVRETARLRARAPDIMYKKTDVNADKTYSN